MYFIEKDKKKSTYLKLKKAGEITQWLSALAALPEEQGSIPNTHMVANNSISRGFDALFSPSGAPCTYVWHVDTHAGKKSIHIKFKHLKTIKSAYSVQLKADAHDGEGESLILRIPLTPSTEGGGRVSNPKDRNGNDIMNTQHITASAEGVGVPTPCIYNEKLESLPLVGARKNH